MRQARRLIVNADDFGLSERVNTGILQAMTHGIVNSTSVMANMPTAEVGIRHLTASGFSSAGIHLNLTCGPSITNFKGRITHGDGTFRGAGLIWSLGMTEGLRATEIKAELSAQIEKVMSLGLSISHIDGHHHIHILPQMAPLICKLAREYKIPAVRLPLSRRQGMRWVERCKWRLVNHFAARSRGYFSASSLAMPDNFLAWYARGTKTLDHLKRTVASIESGTSEIGVHPGFDDESLVGVDSYRNERYLELNALCDPSMRHFIAECEISLVDYNYVAENVETSFRSNSEQCGP
jgi:predicted glycoside hydrolase/deacetylase ChbG (UPF0249 family)